MRISCSLAILSAIIANGWAPDRAFCEEQRKDGQRKIVVVVANGTGLNKKDALADAYRNAVQQVVGLYVDAETLVKNDDLVRQKVLTTSNGYLVDSREISSRVKNGLVRVTIRARVESSKLVAGLNAARITIRKLDGESLFGKALTKMERRENLQQTLLKILVELGPMLEVELMGKPDFDETTSELVFQLKVQPDYEKFVLFRERLGAFLEKVCVRKAELGIRATKGHLKSRNAALPPEVMGELYVSSSSKDLLWGPVLETNKEWVLWLQTFENKSFTSLRWTGYVLDTDWRPVLQTVVRDAIGGHSYSRKRSSFYNFNFTLGEGRVRHPEFGRAFVSTNFHDADEKLVMFDKFELFPGLGHFGFRVSVFEYNLLLPALVNVCPRGIGNRLRHSHSTPVPTRWSSRGYDWK